MHPAAHGAEGPAAGPAAPDPSWSAFEAEGRRLLAAPPPVPAGEARGLAERLASLRPSPASEGRLVMLVFEVGVDLGRHVYAKSVLGDALPEAADRFCRILDGAGLGTLATVDAFHRAATLRLSPGPAGRACDPRLLTAHVAGILCGGFEESFNCRVQVDVVDAHHFHVRLGAGRDVNREGRHP